MYPEMMGYGRDTAKMEAWTLEGARSGPANTCREVEVYDVF